VTAEKLKEINLNFCKKAKEVLAQEVAGLAKRICLLLNIHQHGNESLMRVFENSDDFDEIEAMDAEKLKLDEEAKELADKKTETSEIKDTSSESIADSNI
jgi:hypothetical protein